jgi:subtilase family serine protease
MTAVLAVSTPAFSQSRLPAPRSRVLQAVDEAHITTLSGNTHPLARPEFDQGTLADATPMHRIVLILQRSPEQEQALQQLIDQQQDKTSTTFHQWLTPETFGTAFGPTDRDLSAVLIWLSGLGFSGIQVNPARTFIEFSGTAGMVRTAFRTSMHRYSVKGEQHFANASDPAIPAALAPLVAGIASLNNFPRRAQSHRVGNFRHNTATNLTTRLPDQSQITQPQSAVKPTFTVNEMGNISYGVTPYDFATIYNVLPLWNESTPIDGTGQTIAIVGQTDINPADFVNFRKLFNLPLGNTATPTGTQYLNIIYNGPNPGVNSDEGEADIDTQWSAAVAKGATIDYVVSQGTEVTQGTDLSAIYIVDNNLAPVMSYSYGQCELFLGTSGNAFYKTLWQQAAAQGITVLLASGDSGAAGCDTAGAQGAGEGIAVNGLASTPYNIAVGGTDFYMPNGGTAFWNTANDPSTQASVKGYIPETPWNESCTNSVFSTSRNFSGQTPEQVCNSTIAASNGFLSVIGAGGGPSACIQSNGSSVFSCKSGYAKPSWQTGLGVPADGVRDIPDVSLFSSAGFFGAFYVVCQQSTNPDGQPCSLNAPTYDFAGYGGTSVSTPAFAGILSLVNQKTGSRLGNANYVLYNLAAQQARAGASCTSITGVPASGCVFNDVTTDTVAMPCLESTPNCIVTAAADHYGVLSGYSSNAGYDLATGLGSVNAANLVDNWSNATFTASTATLTLSQTSITHGSQVSASVKVASTTGTPTGSVSINALVSNGSVQNGTLQNGSYTGSLSNFPGGSYSVQAHYAGDGTYAPSDSNSLTLNVSPESSTTTLRALLYNPSSGSTTALGGNTTYPYGGFFLLRADVAGVSGQGSATGNVVLTDSGVPLDGGIFRLNSTSNTEDQARALTPGTHVITAAYSGDASFNPSTSSPVTINITKAQTTSVVQVDTPVLSAAGTLVLTAQVSAHGFGLSAQQGFGAAAPTGPVTFTSGALNLGRANLGQNIYPVFSTDSGTVNITIPANLLPVGTSAITASYAGDANYTASVSPPTSVIVTGSTQVASLTSLSLSSNAVPQGAAYSFTVTVNPGNSHLGGPQPTGTVTFTSDGQPIGQAETLVSAIASISGASLTIAPGTHLIAAIYSGDAYYQSSISTPATFTLGAGTPSGATTIAITPSTAVQGTTVTVAASITPATPAPTGTVQLLLDGTLYGSPLTVTGATTNLSLLTSTLQPGTHVLRVFYSGDSNHQAGTSAAVTLTILAPVGAFTLSPSTTSTTATLGKISSPVTLTTTPTGGFHSTVNFACTGGLPSGAVCLFAPSSLNLTGATAGTTVFTISAAASVLQATTTPVDSEFRGRSRATTVASSRNTTSLSVTLASCLLLVFLPRRTGRWTVFTLLLALSTLGILSGCGSGGIDPNGPSSGALSAGSYAVTVTASGGSTIQTATINLTIQ